MDVFLIIVVLALLAFGATSKRAYRARRNRVVAALLAGGWLAVGVGLLLGQYGMVAWSRPLFGPDAEALITASRVEATTPIILLGLGWIGFMVGLQLRRDIIRRLPAAAWRVAIVDTVVSPLWAGVAAWFAIRYTLGPDPERDLLMGAALVGASAIGWSMETRSLRRDEREAVHSVALFVRVTGSLAGALAVAAFGVLLVVAVNSETRFGGVDWWEVTRTLAASVLAGLLLGVVGRFLMREAGRGGAEQLTVVLGLVVLAAGIGAQLRASPLLTPMIAGVVIANLPGWESANITRFLAKAEHVVAVAFALLAGVLMDPRLGWIEVGLAAGLALTRTVLKPLSVWLVAGRQLAGTWRDATLGSLRAGPIRQSPIAAAIAVSVAALAPDDTMRRILTVVLLTGLLCEIPAIVLGGQTRQRAEERESAEGARFGSAGT